MNTNASSINETFAQLIDSVRSSTNLTELEKNTRIGELNNAKTSILLTQITSNVYGAGLLTAEVVAGFSGAVVAVTSGIAAVGTIATLSQTPAGQKILTDMYSAALTEEFAAINNNPFMQSLYAKVLQEEGFDGFLKLVAINGLALRGFLGKVINQVSCQALQKSQILYQGMVGLRGQ